MPATNLGYLIDRAELASWIIQEDDDEILFNKPALVAVHPSKNGPWSSLVGACREYTGLPRVHLVFRLDRETSGVVVVARNRTRASLLQTAVEQGRTAKRYLSILHGEFLEAREVDVPIGPDLGSVVVARRIAAPSPNARPARTLFRPLAAAGGFTVVEAVPVTGRTHQIRAHAEWLGHRVVGDKIYGPSPACFLEFIEDGWSESLQRRLLLNRQALHCLEVTFRLAEGPVTYAAPPTQDLADFARARMGVDLLELAGGGAAGRSR